MPASEVIPAAKKNIPGLDKSGEWVRIDNQMIPFITFYLIHETNLMILNLLELYPLKSKESRQQISEYLKGRSEFLCRLLLGVSAEGWGEAFEAAVAIKNYLHGEDEIDRLRAWERLTQMRKLLRLDEFFCGNKTS